MMRMKCNDCMHGFIVRSVRELPEQKATMYQLEYQKNGAQLIWMDNGEANKLFSIAFQTLPTDDTGVFHILEHSVLCGSDRFPVREPFVELIKSSMNTFLNAMTFPDKTVYPVSSRNETDFMNLTRVYLDAVFAPAIYQNRHIFEQEGWHYACTDADREPIYKGVVFNEMKGAFSSVNSRVYNGINRLLFPNSCYRFVSGGDPKQIPKLTYEQFLATHRACYHPSNARIYLDGNVPLDRVLALLDEYLSRYEAAPVAEVMLQQPVSAVQAVEYYPIGEEEAPAGKTQVALGRLVCRYDDMKTQLAMSVLNSYLAGSNEAPLMRAVLQKGLAEDLSLSVLDGVAQIGWMLRAVNTEYEKRGELKATIRETVETLLQQGLDREELSAAIDQLEFRMRDLEEPRGLERNLAALSSWLYGGDPAQYLLLDEPFAALRSELHTSYYENLLRELFLDDAHTVEFCLLPSKTLAAKETKAERDELAAKKAAWTSEELQQLLEQNQSLQTWQSQADTPESLATLPVLPISEVGLLPEKTATERLQLEGVPVLFHPTTDGGILHFNLYISLADCAPERLSDFAMLAGLPGNLPTRQHTVVELQRELKRTIGSWSMQVQTYSVRDRSDCCKPYFTVQCSVLPGKLARAVELIAEMLKDTVYDGESVPLIRDILMQEREGMRRSLVSNGHSFAMLRARSHVHAATLAGELTGGYTYYGYLNRFAESFDTRIADFGAYAGQVRDTLLSSARLTVSVTAEQFPQEALRNLISMLNKPGAVAAPDVMLLQPDGVCKKEWIQIPSGVSYAVSADHLNRYGMQDNGVLEVLSMILSYEYLWNEIRVRGGAYGSGFRVGDKGTIGFYSYRDPSPLRSLEIYRNTSAFIRNFCAQDGDFTRYIISTIGRTEPLRSPGAKGIAADADVFSGITYEDHKRLRAEMLQAKKEDLLSYCDLLDSLASKHPVCVVGSADAAKECDDSWTMLSL